MAANIFGRYVWLVDLLRQHKHLSYKEIREKWRWDGPTGGDGTDDLPLRTFHHHRDAIRDIFGIDIDIDPTVTGYKYHIVDPDSLKGDALRGWLIDSYATLNQVQADPRLKDRVEFENIPSGNTWLTLFMQAMRGNRVMEITHKGFDKQFETTFEIHPYSLKVANRRWYIVAFCPYFADWNERHKNDPNFVPKDEIRTFGLDRILAVRIRDDTFVMKKDFSMKKYFEGCTGIIATKEKPETVRIKAYGPAPDYLRTLPLHESQREEESGDGYAIFSYEVKITYDLLQLVMAQGDQVEVLEPSSLRNHMKELAKTLTSFYNS